jgi:flagellar protein FliS
MRSVSHAYLEEEILQAGTIKLVKALYQAAVNSIAKARSYLLGGQIRERSDEITRACEILAELSHGLDLKRGGDLAARLGQLYDYMQRRLIEANVQQSALPMNEVESLLRTLLGAWEECDQKNLATPPNSAPLPQADSPGAEGIVKALGRTPAIHQSANVLSLA